MTKITPATRDIKPRLNEIAYELIKKRIQKGEYVEDQMISVPDLIKEIGASRRPVMQAMTRLSEEGLVDIIPQVGCRVAGLGKRPIQTPTSRSDIAYDYIKNALIEGEISVGEYIDIESYMARIGSSRQPVMDALRRLSTEGFLTIIPQVGCRVATPSADEIVDFFRVFAATDGICAALAAERRSDAQLEHLRDAMDKLSELEDNKFSPKKLSKLYRLRNRQFHQCIHDMAQSATVTKLVERYWDLSDFYIWGAPDMVITPESVRGAQEEHAEIIELLEKRDNEGLKVAVENHLMAFAERVVEANAAES